MIHFLYMGSRPSHFKTQHTTAVNHNLPCHANANECSTWQAFMIGTLIYFILSFSHPVENFPRLQVLHSPLYMKLLGKFEVVKLHLYKYWMMPGTEASAGTSIDFISLFS